MATKRQQRGKVGKVKAIEEQASFLDQTPQMPRAIEPLVPRTDAQKRYMSAIKSSRVTFGVGPAGTGKTYVAGALAAEMLLARKIDRIVITRPAVEAGESFGFLPGELDEKFEPYVMPFLEVLHERVSANVVKALIKSERLSIAPLAFMRGRTFKRSFVILDEAQNTTPKQMQMFLTRIGEGCTVVVNGDDSQCDLPGKSGLSDAIERLSKLDQVKVVRFTIDDCVRSDLVGQIIRAYAS